MRSHQSRGQFHPSREMSLADISLLSATNEGWRKRLSSVHSRKSIATTVRGLSQQHCAIFSAVMPEPQRPFVASGKLENEHSGVPSFENRAKTSRLDAGVNPARTLAAYFSS